MQAKFYNGGNIGLQAVQEVYASLSHWNADDGWVVTNGVFSDKARVLADDNGIRLVDGNALNSMIQSIFDGSGAIVNTNEKPLEKTKAKLSEGNTVVWGSPSSNPELNSLAKRAEVARKVILGGLP